MKDHLFHPHVVPDLNGINVFLRNTKGDMGYISRLCQYGLLQVVLTPGLKIYSVDWIYTVNKGNIPLYTLCFNQFFYLPASVQLGKKAKHCYLWSKITTCLENTGGEKRIVSQMTVDHLLRYKKLAKLVNNLLFLESFFKTGKLKDLTDRMKLKSFQSFRFYTLKYPKWAEVAIKSHSSLNAHVNISVNHRL